MNTKLKIWTIACDDDTGTYTLVFTDQLEATNWMWENVVAPMSPAPLAALRFRFGEDYSYAIEALSHPLYIVSDTHNLEEHDIDIPTQYTATMEAAHLLIHAYNQAQHSQSIDWNDVDAAYAKALEAVGELP